MRRPIHAFLSAIFGLAGACHAQTWDAVDPTYPAPDVRAAGMNGAFISIADGPGSVFWNPAGLTNITFPVVGGGWHLDSRESGSLSFAAPVGGSAAVGVGWQRRRAIPNTFGQPIGLDRLDAALGTNLSSNIAFGFGLAYLNPQFRDAVGGDGMGLSVNTGLDVALGERFRVSIAAYDVTGTKIHRSGAPIEKLSERTWRFGAMARLHDRLLFSYQHDDGNRLGAEWQFTDLVALRSGAGRRDGEWSTAFGASMHMRSLRLDYAYVRPVFGGTIHRLGLEISFPRGRSQVRMATPQLRPLYASLSKTYAQTPAGSIMLSNQTPEPAAAMVQLHIPHYMAAPTGRPVEIEPHGRKRIFLHAVLNPDAMNVRDDIPILGIIRVVDPVTGETRMERTVQSYLYRRGALTWDDTRKAAAFVTPADPVVRQFVRDALGPWRDELYDVPLHRENILAAAILFETAGAYGITYQVDPNTPYAEVRDVESPLAMLRRIGGNTVDVIASPVKLGVDAAKTTAGVARDVTVGTVGVAAAPVRAATHRDTATADTNRRVVRRVASGTANVVDSTGRALGDVVDAVGYGSLGMVDHTTGTLNSMLRSFGAIGEESLQFLLYPYQSVVNPESRNLVVDDIQYPAELLQSGAGDCDDTTVLVCSLLECAGVSTAFVESPEHLFMMFDTGIPLGEDRRLLPASEDMLVAFEGTWWVPLETTMLSEGFVPAWREAARAAREQAEADSIAVTRVSDAWKTYEPSEYAGPDVAPRELPAERTLHSRVSEAREELDDLWRGSPLARQVREDEQSREELLSLAYWLLVDHRTGLALDKLDQAERRFEPTARSVALRAVAHLQNGQLDDAERLAQRAVEMEPGVPDLRILLNQLRATRADAD